MAARRCLAHGNLPVTYMSCPICGEPCDWLQNAEPAEDWERMVEVARASQPITDDDRIGLWRLEYALSLGYEVSVAESLAASDADMHQLEALIRAKCPLPLAARIV